MFVCARCSAGDSKYDPMVHTEKKIFSKMVEAQKFVLAKNLESATIGAALKAHLANSKTQEKDNDEELDDEWRFTRPVDRESMWFVNHVHMKSVDKMRIVWKIFTLTDEDMYS